ncbi:hypothetical protein E4K72_17805 [Oxalobacteraceae bacterium OM1]|nr:hypothetical protein E4K72_17805 [Oxalobacteraceae bacterium OM1]
MRTGPDLPRLREAYAAVDGIPDTQVTLDIEGVRMPPGDSTIGIVDGRYRAPDDWDGLVLTPDVWLSLSPGCVDAVRPLVEDWGDYGIEMFWRIDGRTTSRFEVAMSHLFGLSYEQAEDLFGMRSDDEDDGRSDKQVFLDRIAAFLQAQDQDAAVPERGDVAQVHTGFAVLASQSETPGAETFDTEASASAVNPIVHEQSVEGRKRPAP